MRSCYWVVCQLLLLVNNGDGHNFNFSHKSIRFSLFNKWMRFDSNLFIVSFRFVSDRLCIYQLPNCCNISLDLHKISAKKFIAIDANNKIQWFITLNNRITTIESQISGYIVYIDNKNTAMLSIKRLTFCYSKTIKIKFN